MFDAYIRVSQLGDRTPEEATEVYEAHVREWADDHHIDLDLVEADPGVSGAVAVADRKLERLIQRVEDGASEGILVPYIDRFGRDLIASAIALKRIRDAGGRLIAVRDNLDTADPGSQTAIQFRFVIAEDARRRSQENWQYSRQRARDKGIYLAARPPFGYMRGEQRQLVKDPDEAPLVREVFRCRARGDNYAQLRRWLCSEMEDLSPDLDPETGQDRRRRSLTKTSVRRMIAHQVYKGMIPLDERDASGERRFVRGKHDPIVTASQWQAAQIRPDYVPRNGKTVAGLVGRVFCETCGRRMKTQLSGPNDRRVTSYVCQNPDCDARAGILASKLDGYVDGLLLDAAMLHEPHVEAVILGDTRYQDALADVEEAQRVLDEFRDDIDAQRMLGRDGFTKGLRIRKDALEKARRDLSRIPPPDADRRDVGTPETADELLRMRERDFVRRCLEQVRVVPAGIEGRGKRIPVAERVRVYWTGSDEPYEVDYEAAQERLVESTARMRERDRKRLENAPVPRAPQLPA